MPQLSGPGIFLVTLILVTAALASSPWSQWSCVAGTWRRSATQLRGRCGGQVTSQHLRASKSFTQEDSYLLGRDKLQTSRVQGGRVVLQRRYVIRDRNVWNVLWNSFLSRHLIITRSHHQARRVTQLWGGSPGRGPGPGGWCAGARPGSGTSVSSSERPESCCLIWSSYNICVWWDQRTPKHETNSISI